VATLPITIFADFSCPYSYVTERALRSVVGSDAEIRYRAFELFPEPTEAEAPRAEDEEWQSLVGIGARVGAVLEPIDFRPRTRKAHEAAAFARTRERESQLRDAIFAAYWTQGRDIGRIDVLLETAGTVGLDVEDLRIALDIDSHADAVLHDEDVAMRLRIPGTPTVYLGRGTAAKVLVGANDPATLAAVIEDYQRIWSSIPENG
jgi:predicted DsbA family dithiol-disulfide isomerase